MAADGLDQEQPAAPTVADDHVRHLAVFIDGDAELAREIPVEEVCAYLTRSSSRLSRYRARMRPHRAVPNVLTRACA